MEKYTFKFDNNTTHVNNPSNGKSMASTIIDAIIANNVKKKMPYISGVIDSDYRDDVKIIVKKAPTPKKRTIKVTVNPATKTTTTRLDDFAKAIKFFETYTKSHDTYDFLLSDGTPVKFFDDEVQIGYKLYDILDVTLGNVDISDNYKRDIVNIFININK